MYEYVIIALCLFGVFAYLFLVRIYIAYRMAVNRYRDPLGWVLLSLFFSPLLTWVILLIVGDDIKARYRVNAWTTTIERMSAVTTIPHI